LTLDLSGLHVPIAGVVEVCGRRVELAGKLAQVGVDPAGIGSVIGSLAHRHQRRRKALASSA
jgi:hypothetical protein